MPEKNEKDSFTFSEKLKGTSTSGTLSKRIPSRLMGSGKMRKTLVERVKRDAPYYITALLLLLILPLLGKFDGFVTDDGIFVPSEEMVDASALRTAYGSLGIVEGELVGEGEAVTQFTGRNPLDLIMGRQAKKVERKKVTKVTYDLIDSTGPREKRDAWKGGAIKKAVQRPTTPIGKLARSWSLGGMKGGSSTSDVVPTGPRGRAYSGVSLRSSTKPLAHYPLNVKGKRGGEGLYSEAARSLAAMPKSGAQSALKEAQLDSGGGVGEVSGMGGMSTQAAAGSGGAYRPNKFGYGILTPWWWELQKMRDKKWMDIEFSLYQKAIDVGAMMACCILFADPKCEKFVWNTGGSGGSSDTCGGMDINQWDAVGIEESFPDNEYDCAKIIDPRTQKPMRWQGGSGGSSGKNAWQTRGACLGIHSNRGANKEASNCSGVNNDPIAFKAEFEKKFRHDGGMWKNEYYHYVLAKIDHDPMTQASYDAGRSDLNLYTPEKPRVKVSASTGGTGVVEAEYPPQSIEEEIEKNRKIFFESMGYPNPSDAQKSEVYERFFKARDKIAEITMIQSEIKKINETTATSDKEIARKKSKIKKLSAEISTLKNDIKPLVDYSGAQKALTAFNEISRLEKELNAGQLEYSGIDASEADKMYVIYLDKGKELDHDKLMSIMRQKGYRKDQLKKIQARAVLTSKKDAKPYNDLINGKLVLPIKFGNFKARYKIKDKEKMDAFGASFISGAVSCDFKMTAANIIVDDCPKGPHDKTDSVVFSAIIKNPDSYVYAVQTEDLKLIPGEGKNYPITRVVDFKKGQFISKLEIEKDEEVATEGKTIGIENGNVMVEKLDITVKKVGPNTYLYTTPPLPVGLKGDEAGKGFGKIHWISSRSDIKSELENGKDLDTVFKGGDFGYVRNAACHYNVGCEDGVCGDDSSNIYKYSYDKNIVFKMTPQGDFVIVAKPSNQVPSKIASFCYHDTTGTYKVISSDGTNDLTVKNVSELEIILGQNYFGGISSCPPAGAMNYRYDSPNGYKYFDLKLDGNTDVLLYGPSAQTGEKAMFCKKPGSKDTYFIQTFEQKTHNRVVQIGQKEFKGDLKLFFGEILGENIDDIADCPFGCDEMAKSCQQSYIYYTNDFPKSNHNLADPVGFFKNINRTSKYSRAKGQPYYRCTPDVAPQPCTTNDNGATWQHGCGNSIPVTDCGYKLDVYEKEQNLQQLYDLARLWNDNKTIISIVAFTSSSDKELNNLGLSKMRNEVVKNYLIDKGVDEKYIVEGRSSIGERVADPNNPDRPTDRKAIVLSGYYEEMEIIPSN